jgi:hypothetical protein
MYVLSHAHLSSICINLDISVQLYNKTADYFMFSQNIHFLNTQDIIQEVDSENTVKENGSHCLV